MAKLTRKIMKVFGGNATTNQRGVFGSLANGGADYSTDPEEIQSLAAWLSGWYSAIVGSGNPTIQDFNGAMFVFGYQLAYLFQTGIPEWNAQTTYYIGSIAQDGFGASYRSLTDGNLNNALTDTANWTKIGVTVSVRSINPAATPSVVLTAADSGKTLLVNTVNGISTIQLPAVAANLIFIITDSGGAAATYPITISRTGSEMIQGVASSFTADANYGSWRIVCDGTNWFFTA